MSASASVTESVDVAAKIASVGHLDPGRSCQRLVRERERDEAEHVDDPDEDHQRRDVREPASDRLRGQPLLGDLHLRDLVDRLAERLPPVRAATGLDAHEDDPDDDRDDRAEHEVRDGLVDRHVDRADLGSGPTSWSSHSSERVELRPPRSRPPSATDGSTSASSDERRASEALHAFASAPKYVASPTPSSTRERDA